MGDHVDVTVSTTLDPMMVDHADFAGSIQLEPMLDRHVDFIGSSRIETMLELVMGDHSELKFRRFHAPIQRILQHCKLCWSR